MIGRTSLALLTLAAGATAALFHVSYDVSALEDRLTATNRKIVDDQEALHVLRAEWSFLNQPARLEELSERYLDLQPLSAKQIGTVAMLPVRLPKPDADAPAATGDGAATVASLDDGSGGPVPLTKPAPPDRPAARITVPRVDETAPRPRSPMAPGGGAIPVAARSLDDVLADVIGSPANGGRRR